MSSKVPLALLTLALLASPSCTRKGEPPVAPEPAPAAPSEAAVEAPVATGAVVLRGVTRSPEGNLTRDEAVIVPTILRDGAAIHSGAWVLVLPARAPGGTSLDQRPGAESSVRPIATGAPGEPLAVPPGVYDLRFSVGGDTARIEGSVRRVVVGPAERAEVVVEVAF